MENLQDDKKRLVTQATEIFEGRSSVLQEPLDPELIIATLDGTTRDVITQRGKAAITRVHDATEGKVVVAATAAVVTVAAQQGVASAEVIHKPKVTPVVHVAKETAKKPKKLTNLPLAVNITSPIHKLQPKPDYKTQSLAKMPHELNIVIDMPAGGTVYGLAMNADPTHLASEESKINSLSDLNELASQQRQPIEVIDADIQIGQEMIVPVGNNKTGTITIQAGETLDSISAERGVPKSVILALNPGIINPNIIYKGQALNLPGATSSTTAPKVSYSGGSAPSTGKPESKSTSTPSTFTNPSTGTTASAGAGAAAPTMPVPVATTTVGAGEASGGAPATISPTTAPLATVASAPISGGLPEQPINPIKHTSNAEQRKEHDSETNFEKQEDNARRTHRRKEEATLRRERAKVSRDRNRNYNMYSSITGTSGFGDKQLRFALINTGHSALLPIVKQAVIGQSRRDINGLYTISAAAQESNYGVSTLAHTDYNFFGLNARDSDPGGDAWHFPSPASSVVSFTKLISADYIKPGETFYAGGTSLKDIYVNYSSSHDVEANSIASIMNVLETEADEDHIARQHHTKRPEEHVRRISIVEVAKNAEHAHRRHRQLAGLHSAVSNAVLGGELVSLDTQRYNHSSYSESALGHESGALWHQWYHLGPNGYYKTTSFIDCSGLVNQVLYDVYGVNIDINTETMFWDKSMFEEIPFSEARAGDFIEPSMYYAVPWKTNGHHVEIVTSVDGNVIDTFGAHQDGVPQPQQVGPAQYIENPDQPNVFLRYIGPDNRNLDVVEQKLSFLRNKWKRADRAKALPVTTLSHTPARSIGKIVVSHDHDEHHHHEHKHRHDGRHHKKLGAEATKRIVIKRQVRREAAAINKVLHTLEHHKVKVTKQAKKPLRK
jgi:beta-N-acetylglucosaminidase